MKREKCRGIIFIFFVLVLSACGNSPQVVTVDQGSDKADTGAIVSSLSDLMSEIREINISNINQHIHPENGLWVITSNGAMPQMENVNQVDKNFPADLTSAQQGELPVMNCELKSVWTREGCFAKEENTFKDEKIWSPCDLNAEEKSRVEQLAQSVSWTVINTAWNARYYFYFASGKWYLAFVDLRTPCQA